MFDFVGTLHKLPFVLWYEKALYEKIFSLFVRGISNEEKDLYNIYLWLYNETFYVLNLRIFVIS